MLWVISQLWAHGSTYYPTRISVLPGTTEAWAVVDGWGVIHTQDGSTWEWICEESIGVVATYDALALSPGSAVVGTSGGIRVLDGCGSSPVPGLPDDAQVGLLAEAPDGFYAAVSLSDRAGIYTCTLAGCTPILESALPNRFLVRSMLSANNKLYATVIREESAVVDLVVRSNNTFTTLAQWDYGDEDVRILGVSGDTIYAWSQPRSAEKTPGLLVSNDGGHSFTPTFSTGSYTDPLPGFAQVGDELYLSSYLGRTWCSRDAGLNFTEVSETAPLVRCAEDDGLGNTWLCTDHFADGFDIARTPNHDIDWQPIACLDQTELALCQQTACGELFFTFTTFGGSTAGTCDPTPDASEAPDRRCGCNGNDTGAFLLIIPFFLRRRTPGHRTT